MEIFENMYYGIGKVALAIAKADGEISKNEIDQLKQKVSSFAQHQGVDLSLVDITFSHFKRYESISVKSLLEQGIHDFHLGDDHLTPKLAGAFKELLISIARAQPPITMKEDLVLTSFLVYLDKRQLARTSN